MKVFNKLFCSLVLVGFLSGCNQGDEEEDTKKQKDENQQEEVLHQEGGESSPSNPQANSNEIYTLKIDGSNLPKQLSGPNVNWIANVSVSQEEYYVTSQRLSEQSFEILASKLAKLKIQEGQSTSIELTVSMNNGVKEELVVTNSKDVAHGTQKTLLAWNQSCSALKEFELSASDMSQKAVSENGGKTVQIKIPVCAFEAAEVETMRVNPSPAVLKHSVTFQCEAEAKYESYSNKVFDLKNPVCRFGHRGIRETQNIDVIVPVGTDVNQVFRPELAFTLYHKFGRGEFDFSIWEWDLNQLPYFATKDEGCNRVEIVTHDVQPPHNEFRFNMFKVNGVWDKDFAIAQRPEITKSKKLEFFLTCNWRGSADIKVANLK